MEVSHGCFSGNLVIFDNLRLIWAEMSGYGVMDYRDVGGPIMPKIDYDAFSEADMLGDWPEGAPDDPLLILLIHEEHHGRIKWQHCPFLADRLEQMEMALMKTMAAPAGVLLTQQFIRGLRTAAHYRQDVLFS